MIAIWQNTITPTYTYRYHNCLHSLLCFGILILLLSNVLNGVVRTSCWLGLLTCILKPRPVQHNKLVTLVIAAINSS